MNRNFPTAVLVFLFSLIRVAGLAQETGAPQGWEAAGKKLSTGTYELRFTLPATGKWQVYAPNQVLLEINTTELKFPDSAILQQGKFVLSPGFKKINSTVFEGTSVTVYEGKAAWTAKIHIEGAVPSKLQGTLYYTYGSGDEFYPSTPYEFTIPLEGGVETDGIRIPSI
ncbi:MAG: hypothetical protein ACO25B_13205, partial [Chitinophagaceae bacterium]